jgi:hypothetical protein
MHVIRDLLDKQIVDRDEEQLGRVDGLIAEIPANGPPRITQLEIGFVPLARRIHRRFEGFAESWHKRFGVRRSARYHIEWSQILDVNVHHVKVDVCVADTTAFDWERWLRKHVVEKIPGSSSEEE